MQQHSKGTSNRYADDLGGNHIDRLRKQSAQLGVFLNYKSRWCPGCGKKKPVKGGNGLTGKFWLCTDCSAK